MHGAFGELLDEIGWAGGAITVLTGTTVLGWIKVWSGQFKLLKSASLATLHSQLYEKGGRGSGEGSHYVNPKAYAQIHNADAVGMQTGGYFWGEFGDSVKKDTETDLYEFKKGGLPGTADFPNGIHMVPTKGNIVLYGPTIKSEPGKAFQVGISKYLLDNSKGSIAFSIVTYDSEGKQIDETSNAVDIKSFANSEWNWIYSGQLILPTGTDTAHFKVYFSGPMEIYVNQTYFGE